MSVTRYDVADIIAKPSNFCPNEDFFADKENCLECPYFSLDDGRENIYGTDKAMTVCESYVYCRIAKLFLEESAEDDAA